MDFKPPNPLHMPPKDMHIPELPKTVHVMDVSSAENFYKRLRKREAGLNSVLKPDEFMFMELHTPAGEIIHIRDVGYYRDTDTLLLVGTDISGHECQIITTVQGLQIVFRTGKLPEERPRPRIGFKVYEDDVPDDLDTEDASTT